VTRSADEAAPIHLFTDGAPASMATIRRHISGCPQCAGANPGHVWYVLTAWHRSITETRSLGRGKRRSRRRKKSDRRN